MEPRLEDRFGLKRSLDAPDEPPVVENKLPKLEDNALDLSRPTQIPHSDECAETSRSSSEPNAVNQTFELNLTTLPEYVLLHLFSYLNAKDLYNLCLCNPRLDSVIRYGKELWRNVLDICNGSSPYHSRLQPFLNDFTTTLHFFKSINESSRFALSHEDECFEHSFFMKLKSLPNLKTFILENHSLDYRMLNLTRLPECLTELRLRRINLLDVNERHCVIFDDLHQNFPNLEVLDVSYCSWVIPKMLCSFAKCLHLKKLIMVGCIGMDNIMPHAAHAADSGFLELETLDWRLTSYISLNEIAVFKKLKNLKHILLENANRCKPNRPEPIPWLPGRRCRLPLKPPLLSNYISTNLETLVVRNYSRITDDTLREVEELFKRIKLLDVTGTKCTAEKVAIFQIRCPDIKILHESITENAELGIGLSESSEPTEDCIM